MRVLRRCIKIKLEVRQSALDSTRTGTELHFALISTPCRLLFYFVCSFSGPNMRQCFRLDAMCHYDVHPLRRLTMRFQDQSSLAALLEKNGETRGQLDSIAEAETLSVGFIF